MQFGGLQELEAGYHRQCEPSALMMALCRHGASDVLDAEAGVDEHFAGGDGGFVSRQRYVKMNVAATRRVRNSAALETSKGVRKSSLTEGGGGLQTT